MHSSQLCSQGCTAHCAYQVPSWRSRGIMLRKQPHSLCTSKLQLGVKQLTTCTASLQSSAPQHNLQQNRRQAITNSLTASLILFSSHLQSAQASLIDEQQADDVFSKAGQSVVSIADYKVNGNQEEAEGTGSGFLWDTYGHVVTNYHVVTAAKQVNTANNTQVSCCLYSTHHCPLILRDVAHILHSQHVMLSSRCAASCI